MNSNPSMLKFWSTIVLAFVISLALMLAAAYLWVFIYSVVINNSGDQAFYEAYAKIASPVVAVAVSFPVFYWVGRYLRRFGSRALFAALAVVAINLLMDAAVLTSLTENLPDNLTISALSALGKISGAMTGARD